MRDQISKGLSKGAIIQIARQQRLRLLQSDAAGTGCGIFVLGATSFSTRPLPASSNAGKLRRAPVQGFKQDLEAALVGHGELADDDGRARGALQPGLDEVRQQPAAGNFEFQTFKLWKSAILNRQRNAPAVQVRGQAQHS